MNHIFYQTKTYYTNTGDALINQALISKLRDYGSLHANCSQDIPVFFLEEVGIRPEERETCQNESAFIKRVLKAAVKARKNEDRVYIFSGLGDMYGGSVKLALRNIATALVFPLFRMLGVKIVRIGRSIGPMSKAMEFSEWVRSLFLSHYFVRDSQSMERCKRMGIRKVKVCPDMSWLYDADHEARVNQTNVVMVNLRNSIFDDVEQPFVDATLSKCEEVLGKLNELLQGDMRVCVAYQIQQDEVFSKTVYDRIRRKYPTEYIDHKMGLSELKDRYGKVDFHISNRMHSLLAGYKYGSLPVALISTKEHKKIAATFEDCGLNEMMVDIYEERKDLAHLVSDRAALMDKLLCCEEEKNKEIAIVLDGIFGK